MFVTNDRRHFLRVYEHVDAHNGLIVILPSADLDEQVGLFNLALGKAEEREDMINMLIEVDQDGAVSMQGWSKHGR